MIDLTVWAIKCKKKKSQNPKDIQFANFDGFCSLPLYIAYIKEHATSLERLFISRKLDI